MFVSVQPVLAALSIGVAAAAPLRAEMREWNDSSGKFKIEAELVEATDAEVKLRRVDGRVITVPIVRLSKSDQEFLQTQAQPLSPAEPLDAVVRIFVPYKYPNGRQTEIQIVGCAVHTAEHPRPIVISSRTRLPGGDNEEVMDPALARAQFYDLRSPRHIGGASRLGLPGPKDDAAAGPHELLIVLPIADGVKLHSLALADKDPEVGETVRAPLLPQPQRSDANQDAPPPIEWTEWKVISVTPRSMQVEPLDGKFPSTGVVPLLNAENQVVGMYVTQGVHITRRQALGVGPSLSVVRAALQKAGLARPDAGSDDGSVAELAAALRDLTPLPDGPVDESAAWRSDYSALVETISVTQDDRGEWVIDWGEARDFGMWYERVRLLAEAWDRDMKDAMGSEALSKVLEAIDAETKRAAARLDGIVWSAVCQQNRAFPRNTIKLDLPDLPEPLTLTFEVDEKEHWTRWSRVRSGQELRFVCRFSALMVGGVPKLRVYISFPPDDQP